MRLRARRALTAGGVRALDMTVHFHEGEELRTEISAKFTRERLQGDLAAAGLELIHWLTDRGRAVRAEHRATHRRLTPSATRSLRA